MQTLEIQGVFKSFQARHRRVTQTTEALAGIDLTIRNKEFCVIIGPSGCGKSTLLRLIDGLLAPTGGQILLDDRPIRGPGPDRGMVFQHSHLLPWRSVYKNVTFGLECIGADQAKREERTQRYIDLVGLKGFERHFPAQLSGGMQQRVALARAFAVEPDIFLLDEPFGALDAQTRLLLQTELERIWSVEHKTTVLITHDMEEAIFLADRVVIMSSRPGRISDIVDVPFERPRTDAIRSHPDFAQMKLDLWDALKKGMADEPA